MNYTVCGRQLLFVEDDEKLKKEMIAYFSPVNTVFTASDVEEAINLLTKTGNFDAVVLDLILRNSMGINLFKMFPDLPPVIILSSLDGEDRILTGLTSGATDYVVKPCSMRLWKRILPCDCFLNQTRWKFSGIFPSTPIRAP